MGDIIKYYSIWKENVKKIVLISYVVIKNVMF